jgi:hypothetical protein
MLPQNHLCSGNHVCITGSFERDEREWLCYKLARTPQWIESRLQLDLLQKQVLSSHATIRGVCEQACYSL